MDFKPYDFSEYKYCFWYSVIRETYFKERILSSKDGLSEHETSGIPVILCKDYDNLIKFIKNIYIKYFKKTLDLKTLPNLENKKNELVVISETIDMKKLDFLKLKIWFKNSKELFVNHPFSNTGLNGERAWGFNLWIVTCEQIEPNIIKVVETFIPKIQNKTNIASDVKIFDLIEEKLGFKLIEDIFQNKTTLNETIVRMSLDHSKNFKGIYLSNNDFNEKISKKYNNLNVWVYNRPFHLWNGSNDQLNDLYEKIWKEELEMFSWKSDTDPALPEFTLKTEHRNFYEQIISLNHYIQLLRKH